MSEPSLPPVLTRQHIFAAIFFSIFLFLLYQMVRLLAPFSTALLWAAVIALALAPLHQRVVRAVRGRTGLAAGIMTVGALVIIVGPTIALLAMLAAQAVDIVMEELPEWTCCGATFSMSARYSR